MSAAAAPITITTFGSAGKRSIGDINMEIQRVSLISGNVSAVATASSLSTVLEAVWVVPGASLTTVTTYSGQTATFAFTDPAATVVGHVILFGR